MATDLRSTINVRLGERLLQTLRVSAAKNARSMNAEIVQRLEASLQPQTILGSVTGPLDGIQAETIEEKALLAIMRVLTAKEQVILRALLDGLVDAREMDE